jgi:hypothetical protein
MMRLALLLLAAIVSTASCEASARGSLSASTVAFGLLWVIPAAFLLGILGASLVPPARRAALWIAAGLGLGPILGGLFWGAMIARQGGNLDVTGLAGKSYTDQVVGGVISFTLVGAVLYSIAGFLVAWLGAELADLRVSRANPG